jgi:RHS repeat-associated protein
MTADFGYTGLYYHLPSGLDFATYRQYDPPLERWTSRDPIASISRSSNPAFSAEILEGPNLYIYCGNDGIDHTDPSGLVFMPPRSPSKCPNSNKPCSKSACLSGCHLKAPTTDCAIACGIFNILDGEGGFAPCFTACRAAAAMGNEACDAQCSSCTLP